MGDLGAREAALREAAQCAIDNQDCSPWEVSEAILNLIGKKPAGPHPAAASADDVRAGAGFDQLVIDAINEAERAMQKFPQPNYVISKIAEEAGEVVKAAIHCAEWRETPENLRGEMKQLIAMLYRLWVEGDEVHGLPAVSEAMIPEAKP